MRVYGNRAQDFLACPGCANIVSGSVILKILHVLPGHGV